MLNTKLLGSVSAAPSEFVEDVFSTYLYTGNGSTQTITNGIDLAGEGGMVWCKDRSNGFEYHHIFDTVRGATKGLYPNTTDAEADSASYLSSFNNNGFTIAAANGFNTSGRNEVSWTFRKAPKFFDVVTYTGNGVNGRTVAHNLGSVPGMIIVKCTNGAESWRVYHRSLGATKALTLNSTSDASTSNIYWNDTEPTASVFSLYGYDGVNGAGLTYVAYLFAHNAGGFGAAGTDNVISCGSFTTNGSGTATVNLGYEPQYVLWKQTDGADNWYVNDVMRGMSVGSSDRNLSPNTSGAESAGGYETDPTATGFIANPGIASKTYIYMAIRRPMKPPTSGTEVFSPIASTASTGTKLTTNFPIDLQISNYRPYGSNPAYFVDRLRGASSTDTDGGAALTSTSTAAEVTSPALARAWDNTGFKLSGYYGGADDIFWNFRRATGFFDVVCYTGTGSARTVAHNLGAVPELMIFKDRSGTNSWGVYASALTATSGMILNNTGAAFAASSLFNNTEPTSTQFTVNTTGIVNSSGANYVAYLFATLAGVSKVGSYTGDGTDGRVINCGFTGGARFVLIKSTSNTGNWRVWDTARGIVSGNDPFLALNTTAAESTNSDDIDPTSSGFIVNYNGLSAINESGWEYIFLAIA